jgi:hypothetical protein
MGYAGGSTTGANPFKLAKRYNLDLSGERMRQIAPCGDSRLGKQSKANCNGTR